MANMVGGQVVWNLDVADTGLTKGLANARDAVADTAKSVGKGLDSISSQFKSFGGGLTQLVTVPITAIGGLAIAATTAAGKYSSVLDSFKSMTKNMGIDAVEFQKVVAKATGNQIDDLTILQSATRSLALMGAGAFNDFGQDFTKMAELSKKAARATGQDVDYMFNSLINGITKESVVWLDNLAIHVDIEKTKEAYAISIGKTVEALTNEEQKHALLNESLKQLEGTYGMVAVSAGGFQGAMQALKTEITNSWMEVGLELEPAIADLTKSLTQLLKDVMPGIVSAVRSVIKWFTSLDKDQQKLVLGVILLAAVLGPIIVTLGLVVGAIMSLINPVGLAIAIITLLVAAGAGIYMSFKSNFMGITTTTNTFIEALKNGFTDLKNKVVEVFTGIINFVKSVPAAIGVVVEIVKGVLVSFVNFMMGIGLLIANAVIAFAQPWIWAYENIYEPVIMLITAIILRFAYEVGKIAEKVFGVLVSIGSFILGVMQGISDFVINNIIKPFIMAFVSYLTLMKNTVDTIFNAIVFIAKLAWSIFGDTIIGSVKSAVTFAGSLIKGYYDFMQGIFNGIVDFLKFVGPKILDAIVWPFEKAKEAIEKTATKIKELADKINPLHRESPSLVDNVKKGIKMIASEYDKLSNMSMSIPQGYAMTGEGSRNINITNNLALSRESDIDALNRKTSFMAQTL